MPFDSVRSRFLVVMEYKVAEFMGGIETSGSSVAAFGGQDYDGSTWELAGEREYATSHGR